MGISPSLLPIKRASAHHYYQEIGRKPTIVTARAKVRLPIGLTGVHLSKDRTSDLNSVIWVPLSDNN